MTHHFTVRKISCLWTILLPLLVLNAVGIPSPGSNDVALGANLKHEATHAVRPAAEPAQPERTQRELSEGMAKGILTAYAIQRHKVALDYFVDDDGKEFFFSAKWDRSNRQDYLDLTLQSRTGAAERDPTIPSELARWIERLVRGDRYQWHMRDSKGAGGGDTWYAHRQLREEADADTREMRSMLGIMRMEILQTMFMPLHEIHLEADNWVDGISIRYGGGHMLTGPDPTFGEIEIRFDVIFDEKRIGIYTYKMANDAPGLRMLSMKLWTDPDAGLPDSGTIVTFRTHTSDRSIFVGETVEIESTDNDGEVSRTRIEVKKFTLISDFPEGTFSFTPPKGSTVVLETGDVYVVGENYP